MALRVRLKERVNFVTVDEYQDLNPLQVSIVRELHDLGTSICVVGDDDQTIYQWRGSDMNKILTFAKRYPKVKQVPLEANFRSSKGIVETARVFVEQKGERLPKQMKASGEQVYEEGDVCALKLSDPADEAKFIVKTIQHFHGVAFKENGTALSHLTGHHASHYLGSREIEHALLALKRERRIA